MNFDQILITLPFKNEVVSDESSKTKWSKTIFSLLCKQQICGICLSTAEDLISLDFVYDKGIVMLNKESTLRSLITSTFGCHVLKLLPSPYLCGKCAKKIVKSHSLVQEMNDNYATLTTYLDLIERNANDKEDNKIISVETQSKIDRHHKNPVHLNSKIKCPLCEKLLEYHLLNKHYKERHSKEKVFKCYHCLSIHYDLELLLDHRQADHKENICKICYAIVNISLNEHIAMHHSNKNLKCNICTKMFPAMDQLEQHLLQHESTNIICQYCLKCFVSDSYKDHKCIYKCEECVDGICIHEDYLVYYRDQHLAGKEVFRCINCEYTFKKVEEIIAHANNNHLLHYPNICHYCGEQYASVKKLQEHTDTVHKTDELSNNVGPFKCELSFQFKENVSVHLKPHFKCKICSTYFKSRRILNHHMKDFHKITLKKLFKCTRCPEDYRSQIEYRKHLRSHPQDSKHVCRQCGASFLSKYQFYHHTRKHKVLKKVECTICHKDFVKTSLKQHYMRVHEKIIKEKPSSCNKCVCDVCGKVLFSEQTLKKHRNIHNPTRFCQFCCTEVSGTEYKRHAQTCKRRLKIDRVKCYKCQYCDYSTSIKVCLTAHTNRHLKVRPYKCEVCDKSFFASVTLNEHKKTHLGNKPEQCELCNDRFGSKKALMLHVRLHTGEKPYECDLCDEKFISSSRRQSHKIRKHFEPAHRCSFCTKKCFTKPCLNRHIKSCHSGNEKKSEPADIVVNDET